jgi:hypothetical protein
MTPEPKNYMYLRSEIRSQVAALALAAANVGAAGCVNVEYAAGYIDALRAVLVTFGVELPADDWPPVGCPTGHEGRTFRVVGSDW